MTGQYGYRGKLDLMFSNVGRCPWPSKQYTMDKVQVVLHFDFDFGCHSNCETIMYLFFSPKTIKLNFGELNIHWHSH